MHELAVCQAMLEQVEEIAVRENALSVSRILVRIGPLSGVVPELLEQAFSVARAGTIAEAGELKTEPQPIRVRCSQCGEESEASPSKLICAFCGDYRTELISGDELLLASVELERN